MGVDISLSFQGGGFLVVCFAEGNPLSEAVTYTVCYESDLWRHLTTGKIIDRHTLQAPIPG